MLALPLIPAGPPPSMPFVVVTGAVAFLLVVAAWNITEYAITIAHEGGHAFVASSFGARIEHIIIRRDRTGETKSVGLGPFGQFFTGLAGYLGPSLFGLAGALLLYAGHVRALLWLSVGFLVCALFLSRHWYSALTVVATGAVVFLVVTHAGPGLRMAFAYTWVWFLLIGSLRDLAQLSRIHRANRGAPSDARMLRDLTRLPARIWVSVMGLLSTAVLLAGALVLVHAV